MALSPRGWSGPSLTGFTQFTFPARSLWALGAAATPSTAGGGGGWQGGGDILPPQGIRAKHSRGLEVENLRRHSLSRQPWP